MPADALLSLQATTTQTSSGNSTGISIRKPSSTTGTNRGGTPRRGLVVRVVVTAASGTTPTAAFKLQVSDDNSAYVDRANALTASVTGAGEYFIPYESDKPWVRLAWTLGGTSPSFTFFAEVVAGRP